MSKITITLDAAKLRNLVTKREFNAKDGTPMHVQEVRFELVPVKEPKIIHEGNGYKLQKSHFASVIQTKEEREAQAERIIEQFVFHQQELTIEFSEWLRNECYDTGDKWLYQEDDETYTSLEIYEIFKRKSSETVA